MKRTMSIGVWIGLMMVASVPAFALQALPPAQDTHAFTVRGGIGLVNGQAGEYVYEGSHTLSELLWDIDGIAMAGLTASWRFADRWSINAGFWTALNKGNGEMTDYDWFVVGFPEWTHYSRSDVEVEQGRIMDINIGFRLNPGKRIAWTALVGYRQDFWEWTDSAQEFIYSDEGFRDWHGHFEGVDAIDYEQSFDIPYVGLHAAGPLGTRFHWEASLIASVFGSAEALDHHILRDTHFKDSFSGLTYIGLGLAGSYMINERSSLELAVHAQHIPESRGDGIVIESGTPYNDGAGIALDTSMLSITYARRF